MKYIDVRRGWVQELRDRKMVELVKVLGTENLADYFTKLLEKVDYERFKGRMMVERVD